MFSHRTQTTLIAWLATVVLASVATNFPALWSLDTALVCQGEWWRLISGQLVHLTWQHYCYDLLALGLVLWLCSRMAPVLMDIAWTALCSAGVVSLAMVVLRPVEVYGGLSGIIAGLLAWAAIMLIRQKAPVTGLALVSGILIKICMEQHGVSVSGVEAVWQVHCAGALAGALCGVFPGRPALFIRSNREMRSTP